MICHKGFEHSSFHYKFLFVALVDPHRFELGRMILKVNWFGLRGRMVGTILGLRKIPYIFFIRANSLSQMLTIEVMNCWGLIGIWCTTESSASLLFLPICFFRKVQLNLKRKLASTVTIYTNINHGNLRYPPQGHPPPRNKALIRPY